MNAGAMRYWRVLGESMRADEPPVLPQPINSRPLLKSATRALQLAALVTRIVVKRPREALSLPRWIISLADRRPVMAHTPLFSYSAITYLTAWLQPSDRVFEYGSGGSTLWLADRAGSVISVEHDPRWYHEVKRELARSSRTNCQVLLREIDSGSPAASPRVHAYIHVIDNHPDGFFDAVFVDGVDVTRPACLRLAAKKVRAGGLVVLDDSNRTQYQAPMAELRAWRHRDFWGVRPHFPWPSQTTCWRRPA